MPDLKIPEPELYMPLVELALKEDIGNGDITTNALDIADRQCEGLIKLKEDGVVAGIFVAEAVFRKLDSSIEFESHIEEGLLSRAGTPIATVRGSAGAILAGERVALNFLQRISGVATFTHQFMRNALNTKTEIRDTRKTMPGMRALDKFAVLAGGGFNHRFCLDDAVLIKDNHIAMAGGVKASVEKARANVPSDIIVEVETTNMDEVREAVEAGADIIMLDNMSLVQLEEAIKYIDGRAKVEVSGNVNMITVGDYVDLGADIVSVGALTHSADALDIGLDFKQL